jgi:hypothetical protein
VTSWSPPQKEIIMNTVRSRRTRLLVAGLGLTLASVAGIAGSAGTASADGLGTIGGCWAACAGETSISNTPGGTLTAVACAAGAIAIQPLASAQAGYPNGQYARYRYYLRAATGYAFTSGWSGATLLPSGAYVSGSWVTTPLTNLPGVAFPVAHTTWTVQVQYQAWNGAQWLAPSYWQNPTNGYQLFYASSTWYSASCTT